MYVSTMEFAKLEGISYSRAYELLGAGLPSARLESGKVLIDVPEARKWRQARLKRAGRPRRDAAPA